jgi:protein-tyrosine phosphatase
VTDTERHVVFEACFNFRDFGGYETSDGRRTRWKTLYRSDTLHRLTEADAETFSSLGLRTVIDLRSSTELDDHGRLSRSVDHLTWHHVPMLDNVKLVPRDPADPPPLPAETAPGEGYVRILEQFGTSVGRVFDLLAARGALPAVFHCTSGKDRTGMVAALLLEVLGVPDDVIAADYVLTERARARSMEWIEVHEPGFAAFLNQIPPERRGVRPETILGFLSGVRERYGGAEGFLTSTGVGPGALDRLRQALVED